MGTRGISWGPLLIPGPSGSAPSARMVSPHLGRTDNSWGPPGNRGSWGPCVLGQTKKKTMKKVPGACHGAPY
ncbi:unnamed protein product [Staurois parvus]|uniref:Uncharacterized protein n=1 Tax=Staurois parvus TaxID=386267 RepID=A0ABN9HDI5_9NEOB|nr:unnamed protein product [Staurois parvus]